MAREKRIKEIRKSYAIIGEGITEFFYFDGFRNVEKDLLKKFNVTLKPDKPKHPDYSDIITKAQSLLAKEFDVVFCLIDMDYIKKNVRNVVFISAKSGSGASELEKVVSDIIGTSQLDPSAAIIANERQRDCAKRARDFLNEAINALEMGITLDAVTVIIEDAISALLELTGERASEAVVDSVFSHFCVGK